MRRATSGWRVRREPVTAPGYPESEGFPVRRCLQAVLSEEWEHRLYAEHELEILVTPRG